MSTLRGFVIAATVTGIAAVGVLSVMSVTDKSPKKLAKTTSRELVQEQIVRSAPAFDIVRVDTLGIAVVAGTAEPGATVALMMGDTMLASAIAGADGSWSIVIETALPTGEIEMYLLATLPTEQTIRSKNVVIVSVPETRDRLPLVVLGAPGGASRVLQDPQRQPRSGSLVLETIDYDREGGVIFAGLAKTGLTVRVFSDGNLIGEAIADEDGRWVVISRAPLSMGLHQLQIDEIEASGRVIAVLALPFERANPTHFVNDNPGTVIVQPGASLWRIARRLYGQGWQYTMIYSQNQDQIRNPDLIYPGQVLLVPAKEPKTQE